LDIEQELYACFIGCQKAFDLVNWTQLMKILKGTGIDWHEGRLIIKLYMGWSIKLKLDQGERRLMKTGRGIRQGCCSSPILFKLYSECITKEPLEGFEDFKIGGQVICSVKYEDDVVLLA